MKEVKNLTLSHGNADMFDINYRWRLQSELFTTDIIKGFYEAGIFKKYFKCVRTMR